jgi:vitamin B12 transporter
MPALPISTDQIIITASRVPTQETQTPASVTIIDQQRIERLGEPLVSTLLRLTPSAAVAASGPAGSFTEVRIRGAENNHTLLFIDGIRANDPASGDFARFELLNADIASRIEVLRGPQSALWGSDAIGGVIAVNGTNDPAGYAASAEAGSYGFARASGSAAISSDKAALAGAVGWQRASGIDSFGAPGGDRDGYHNLAARLRASAALTPDVRLGAAGFALSGYSEFDGYDPVTFARTDTLDNSRNRLDAGRVWVEYGGEASDLRGHIGASLLGSSNRNFLADAAVNRTSGTRRTLDAQVERHLSAGGLDQTLILAAETERETFHARGLSSGLSTDQDRSRRHSALTAEWRAKGGPVVADVALRRDFFNRFKDATTFRASTLVDVGRGFAFAGSFAEGMAQPTFFDLYGTFPNNFIGNPSLEPETSRGFEGSLRFRRSVVSASVTAYRQRLRHEIVDVFNPATFLLSTANSDQVSHRWGVEAEIGWQVNRKLRLSTNYSFLHATQPDTISGRQVRELRRPRHSGAIVADGSSGRWSYGASITYAGSHLDVLEVPPFGTVRVKPYWLVGGRIGYAIRPGVELFARSSNLLGADYQEVAGYHTEGRAVFAGIRLADRRSSP